MKKNNLKKITMTTLFAVALSAMLNGKEVSFSRDGGQPCESDNLQVVDNHVQAATTAKPTATPTSTPKLQDFNEVIATPTPTVDPNAPGWHGSGKTKYYVDDEGNMLKGYKKVGGSYYYFDKTTGYCAVKKWKNIKTCGKKYKLYFGSSGKRTMDLSNIMDKKKNVRYKIVTNLTTNSVMVLAKWNTKTYKIPVRRMRASVGMTGHSTRTGTYSLEKTGSKWHVLRYGSYGQYCTRISGPYLYHSVVYDKYGDATSLNLKEYKKLGKAASHGCIRLQVEDAKWIYKHSSMCTTTISYGKKSESLPIPYPKKKAAIKVSKGHYTDPTDDMWTE